jgi:hypothetical protein
VVENLASEWRRPIKFSRVDHYSGCAVLADLKTVVDTIRDAVSGYAGFRSKKARSSAVLELLCIYFLLLDVAEEGRNLLRAVGSDPRMTLLRAPEIERPAILLRWYHVLCRQASRLYTLSGRLLR